MRLLIQYKILISNGFAILINNSYKCFTNTVRRSSSNIHDMLLSTWKLIRKLYNYPYSGTRNRDFSFFDI